MRKLILPVAAMWIVGACGTNPGAGPVNTDEPDPAPRRITVNTRTTGTDSPSGYTALLAPVASGEVRSLAVGINDLAVSAFQNVVDGAYTLTLDDVPENCTVQGQNPVNLAITGDDFHTFDVVCDPDVGTIQVFIETVLPPTNAQSPGNYQISVDGVPLSVPACAPAQISCGRSEYWTDVRAGGHIVSIAGWPSTCRLLSANPQTAQVPFDAQVTVEFEVDCSGQYGTLRIVTRTTGLDPGRELYLVDAVGQQILLALNGTYDFALVSPGDHVVNLVVSPVDANCLVIGSNPRTETVLVGVTTVVTFDVSCAPTSRPIAFESERAGGDIDIYVMEPDGGSVTPLTTNAADDKDPVWSPDGRQILFRSDSGGGQNDLWLMESGGENPRRLTSTVENEEHPAYSLGGAIVYDAQINGDTEIYKIDPAGGAAAVRITDAPNDSERPRYSPRTGLIVFTSNRDGDWDIYTMSPDGSNVTKLTTATTFDFNDIDPAWSPNGQIVYANNVNGDYDLWLMNADGSSKRPLTTNTVDDVNPSFSSDDSTVVFVRGTVDEDLYSVGVNDPTERPLAPAAGVDGEPDWRW